MVRRIVIVALSFLAFALGDMNSLAYDREAAVDYARYWSEDTGADDGKANLTVYRKFVGEDGYDCANFVSQCLIAGGLRFRSSTQVDDNTRDPLIGSDYPELETRYETVAINSDNIKKYSRTITAASQLPRSLKHTRHGGSPNRTVEYGPPNLQDSGSMWGDVRPGDAFFLWNGTSYWHSMFISSVRAIPPKDLNYCSHSKWRRGHSLSSELSDWKTSGDVRVICLPDAPLLWNWAIRSGENEPTVKWSEKWPGSVFSVREPARKADLIVRLTFDADMKTNEMPQVRLGFIGDGGGIDFQPWADPEINNYGWYFGPAVGNFKTNRTWKGWIPADQMPSDLHTAARILIHAKAADGSYTDKTNDLAKYEPWAANLMICIMIDTRGSDGAR